MRWKKTHNSISVNLIRDTEKAIRQLDPKMHNTYRYLATKKIKQIKATTTHNTLHKRYQYNIKQIRNIIQQNNLTITKADKSKAIVIINKNTLNQKVDDFVKESHKPHCIHCTHHKPNLSCTTPHLF
jgi:hypothetical protein